MDLTKIERTQNLTDVKIGETIIYYEGNLAQDRNKREGGGVSPDSPRVQDAEILNNIAKSVMDRSFAIGGTKEFELKQARLGHNKFAYMARRVAA